MMNSVEKLNWSDFNWIHLKGWIEITSTELTRKVELKWLQLYSLVRLNWNHFNWTHLKSWIEVTSIELSWKVELKWLQLNSTFKFDICLSAKKKRNIDFRTRAYRWNRRKLFEKKKISWWTSYSCTTVSIRWHWLDNKKMFFSVPWIGEIQQLSYQLFKQIFCPVSSSRGTRRHSHQWTD